MRRLPGIVCFLLVPAAAALADHLLSEPHWAIEARFPEPPKTDGILTPSPQGDVKVQRFFWEQGGEHYLLARFEYPLALLPVENEALYNKSFGDLLRSRPGQTKAAQAITLGPYSGKKLIVAQAREKSLREVRFVAIGSILYMASAEWPEAGGSPASQRAARFLGSVAVRPEFLNAREVEAEARWRELAAGNFRLRYDATRWYRDPSDRDPGIFSLLRRDQQAEAQFIVESQPVGDGDIERAVLDTARAGAESLVVKRSGRKQHGATELVELEFAARVGRVTYLNHGYFYSGPEG
ncbi:MAG: hypothetical protein ABUL61_04785, partial [Oleiharenicola lentus]